MKTPSPRVLRLTAVSSLCLLALISISSVSTVDARGLPLASYPRGSLSDSAMPNNGMHPARISIDVIRKIGCCPQLCAGG